MAPNVEFFAKKRVWSVVKDELLRCYLVPYCAKILSTGNPLLYIDCFAGRGNFDDGNNGSPIIALDIFQNYLQKSPVRSHKNFVTAY